jgi:hypothetical protein
LVAHRKPNNRSVISGFAFLGIRSTTNDQRLSRFTTNDPRPFPLTPIPFPDIRDRLEWLYLNRFTTDESIKSERLPSLDSKKAGKPGAFGRSGSVVGLQADSAGF